MTSIHIEKDRVRAVSPEGESASISVAEFIGKIGPRRMDTLDVVLPPGIRWMMPIPAGLIVVHETPPRIYNFKWIARGSRNEFGSEARYRSVKLGLPYLIVIAVLEEGHLGQLRLGSWNECYFRNQALEDPDDELFYPALLNCSKFETAAGRPLSWICTQYLDRSTLVAEGHPGRRFHEGLKALLGHLLETGFNYSSEHHELTSWYSASVKAKIDPRISTVERWQKATKKDPFFVQEVPWLPTGKTLRQMAERIAAHHGSRCRITSADGLAPLIFNAGSRPSSRRRARTAS